MEFRSNEIMHGEDSPLYRFLFRSMGHSNYELDHESPIGIANTWNTCVPGHSNLSQVNEFVEKGVYSAGGTAAEFGTIGCCGGVAQGRIGMNYILPSREIICSSMEVTTQAHRLDGIVLLASCDRIVSGMLTAVARLDIPATVCVDDPILGGIEFDRKKSDLTSIDETKGMTHSGKITEDEYRSLENTAYPGCGSCSFLGTANSTYYVSETMGMNLPGSALISAPHEERLKSSSEVGRAVVNLMMNNITAKQVITKESIRNAIKVAMAICGSTNVALYIAVITNEAGLDMNMVEEFRTLNPTAPQIAKVDPATKWDMGTFYQADGIPQTMDRLGSAMDRSAVTCAGKPVGENLKDQAYQYPKSREIIKIADEPLSRTGGVAVLLGNLAPNTAVPKPGAIDSAPHHFTGKARCYNLKEEAESATLSGEIQRGEVVVICYKGPKGGPDMKEMSKTMRHIYGMGLAKDTALIADGRFSGINNGCFVGHILPEVAEGGPLALVEDGDEIVIDVAEGKLELHASDEIISVRRKHWVKPKKEIPSGYLKLYPRVAPLVDKGVIVQY